MRRKRRLEPQRARSPLGRISPTKEDLLQAIAGENDRIGKVETGIAHLRGDVKAEIANFKASLYWTAWILGASIVTVIFTRT